MNITSVIEAVLTMAERVRNALVPIPGLLLLSTSSRRPGFSSILTSAKIYSDLNIDTSAGVTNNDEILKKFIFNVVDKIKLGLHADAVCMMAIPPGEIQYVLTGGNPMGPIIFNQDPENEEKTPSNKEFVFVFGIIR